MSEGAGYVDLVVSLGAPGQNPVSVNYATANNTAGAGNACNGDYSRSGGTLNFAPGETTKVVRVADPRLRRRRARRDVQLHDLSRR